MQTTNQIHQRRETTELSTYELRNGVGYSTPNEQRGYTPPPTPEPFTPPRVSASAVKVDGSVVEQAHASFTHAKTAFEKFLNDIPREHYSADGLKAQIKKFSDTDAARAVDVAVANVRDRADKATAQVEKIRKDLSPAGDAATELRATRFWNRTQRGLDSLDSGKLFGAATDLIANSSREELGVLLEEIGPYLEARGVTTDWIDTAVGQAVPEYAQATKQHQKAKQALTIAEHNAKSLRTSFDKGYSSSILTDARLYDPDA
jgi:hypothetical protein